MSKSRKDAQNEAPKASNVKKPTPPIKPISQFFAESGLDKIVLGRIKASPREDVDL